MSRMNKKVSDKPDGRTETQTDPIGGNTLNVTDGTIQDKHAVLLTLRSVSMQCSITMQCNAMHNAMQCNAIQCNKYKPACAYNAMQCMYGSPSVRTEWSQSVIFFLFFFHFFLKIQKMTKSCWSQVSNSGPLLNGNLNVRTDGRTEWSHFTSR
jgi:hypothetical protein